MNIEEMTKLIKAVADNKLTSFEIKDGEFKLSIKCEKEAPQIVMAQAPAVPVAAAVPAAASSAFQVQLFFPLLRLRQLLRLQPQRPQRLPKLRKRAGR